MDSTSFEAVNSFQSQYKTPIEKITLTLLQQSAVLTDTEFTDKDNPLKENNTQR